jgi:DNA-binding YbaB/EbfC family protein
MRIKIGSVVMFDPRKLLDMVKNASELQKNMLEKLKSQKVTGEAAGGMVIVEMNGQFEILKVNIDDALLKEEKAFVEDIIRAAMNDASAKVRNQFGDHLKSFANNLGIIG